MHLMDLLSGVVVLLQDLDYVPASSPDGFELNSFLETSSFLDGSLPNVPIRTDLESQCNRGKACRGLAQIDPVIIFSSVEKSICVTAQKIRQGVEKCVTSDYRPFWNEVLHTLGEFVDCNRICQAE